MPDKFNIFGSLSKPESSKKGIGAVAFLDQKEQNLINSAIHDIRSGKYTTQEQKVAIDKLLKRIDDAVSTGRVPSQRDQQAFLNLREARAFNAYQSIKEQAKDPKASVLVKDIASRPYQKDMTNPWKDFKGYNTDTILSIYGISHPERLNNNVKTMMLEGVMREHEAARTAIGRISGVTVTPFMSPSYSPRPLDVVKQSVASFQEYPFEPLNPRISKVTPFVDENTVYLMMTVDGKEKNITVSNKEAVDAFHAGALPLNVLANRALAQSENLQVNLENNFEMVSDEQLISSQRTSLGFHK